LLAIGSIGAGYVGVPHALGGSNRIETFLEPSFEAHAPGASRVAGAVEPGAVQLSAVQAPEGGGHVEEGHAPAADEATELTLMGVSTGIAIAGIGIAFFFWQRSRQVPDAMARQFSGAHRLLLNKYYIDELYNTAVVQPIKLLSTGALWKGVDAGLIDGTVNGVGALVRAGSGGLRRAQTGSIRTYAAGLILGVTLILGWYLGH
jgi:NADH-quinone oxidoreductase subunit L